MNYENNNALYQKMNDHYHISTQSHNDPVHDISVRNYYNIYDFVLFPLLYLNHMKSCEKQRQKDDEATDDQAND
jgi:hypothetical protein